MNKLPTTVYKEIDFRSAASSKSQNEFQETIFEDMMNLYEETDRLEKEIQLTNEALSLNDVFLYGHIRKLENRLSKLEVLASMANKGDASKTTLIFVEDMKADPDASIDERAHIDPIHQVIHLPIAGQKLSKLHQYDSLSKSPEVPKELKIEVYPKEEMGWIIEENDLRNAVDGVESTYWRRKIMLPLEDSQERIRNEVILTIPDSSIFNREVNMITLNPFPAHSMNIETIEYRSAGEWRVLPGWENKEATEYRVKEAGRLKLCFPNISVVDLKITLSQDNWYEEHGQKVFHFGLNEVSIHHVDFRTSVGRFEATADIGAADKPRAVTGIKPIFSNESTLTDRTEEKSSIFDYDLYIMKDNGDIQYTKDRFPVTISEGVVLIKGSIGKDKQHEGSPLLHSIELTYEDV